MDDIKGHEHWKHQTIVTLDGYHKMIAASVNQLSAEQLFAQPKSGFNSVAKLLRHLGGNLHSRWTNFLTEDGEKPDRNRDSEFEDWDGDSVSLMQYFNQGWQKFRDSISELTKDDFQSSVRIRGERHTVPQAILRSLTHIAYHTGQITLIARMVFDNDSDWEWMTIKPGTSEKFNNETWGTAKSRGVAGEQ